MEETIDFGCNNLKGARSGLLRPRTSGLDNPGVLQARHQVEYLGYYWKDGHFVARMF